MNKKILACILIVLLAAAGTFVIINYHSKNNNEQANNTVASTEDDENNNAADTNNDNNDNNNTTANSSNSTTDNTSNSSNNSTVIDNDNDIDAAAKADIAKTEDDAVKKLLDYYLGTEDAYIQNTVKVTLTTNPDNTITASKTDSDSNIYYSGVSQLSDNSQDGLIISIDNYNEADKTYSYSLKNYSDLKSGKTNNVLDSGLIPEEGNVTSYPKK